MVQTGVKAKEGDKVRIHYVCKLDDGMVFDTSEGCDPFELKIGDGSMPPGFEGAVVGMSSGQHRTTAVPAYQAYGLRNEDLVLRMRQGRAFQGAEIGDVLQIKLPSGKSVHVVVTDISEMYVTLDANHPLAGRDLTFEIELLDIL